jgi:hypothetical protein
MQLVKPCCCRQWQSGTAITRTHFCKYVLGIDFFSRGQPGDRGPNLYQPHGHTQEVKTLTQEEKSFSTVHRFAGVDPIFRTPNGA